MRFLFDHNLSPRLVQRLVDLYPDTSQIFLVGMDRASDLDVWLYAHANDSIIITKDSDFSDLSVLRGFPPKVIWLRMGNCTTSDVERTLRTWYAAIMTFAHDPSVGVLELL